MYIGQWSPSPLQSRHLGPHTVLPVAASCPIVYSWISPMVWNLFPFKGDFSFEKSQKLQGTKSGMQGSWVIWVIWCCAKQVAWDMMYKQVRCHAEAANQQLPIAAAFCIIWIVSVEECSSFTQNLVQIYCSTCSVILNVKATQYTCSLNSI